MPYVSPAELVDLLETEAPVPLTKVCCRCESMATWLYMPGASTDKVYCDKHVPRGCSCNIIDSDDENETQQDTDMLGRLLPCVEYWEFPEGIEQDQ